MIDTPGKALFNSCNEPEDTQSQSCTQFVRHRRCCSMIELTSCLLVRRNVATGGGTDAAIWAICSSLITPGPLGIAETSPRAEAPAAIARWASATEPMQQIFTRGARVGPIGYSPYGTQMFLTCVACCRNQRPSACFTSNQSMARPSLVKTCFKLPMESDFAAAALASSPKHQMPSMSSCSASILRSCDG